MSLKLNERYPGRFNNPSADYPGGSFKNRTTPTAKDGSYLEQDWANDKEGFFQSLLSAAGLTANGQVDKVGASQAYDAMRALDQRQSGIYFATTGTSTAQVLTPTPALVGYSPGVRYSVAFNVASGLNPNIKVSGLNGKFLKQYDGTGAKVAAVWAAGQVSDIVYDGTDFILLDPAVSVSPASTTVVGIARFGTPAEQVAGILATVMANPQGVMALVTAMFPKRTFTANDFIRLPDVPGGLVIQWAAGTAVAVGSSSSVTQDITFPTPFTNGALRIIPGLIRTTVSGGAPTIAESQGLTTLTKTNLTIVSASASATNSTPTIIAIGY